MSVPSLFQEAWDRNYQRFANNPVNRLKARLQNEGWTEKTTMKTKPVGGGSMRDFEEKSLISPDGKQEVKLNSATSQAAEYAQQHPMGDPSETPENWLLFSLATGMPSMVGGRSVYSGLLGTANEAAPYFTARGWLSNPTFSRYITPTAATAVDAALVGSATGASINDMRQNGPTVGNVLGTTLGVGGLAFEAVPTVIEGAQAAKRIYDNGTLWDKYTTLGGRFGYYGNPLQRAWGTISRNFGLPSTSRHPELLRKLGGLPRVTDEGLLDFNSARTGLLGTGHSNWTLDRPVVSHNKGNWDGKDLFIVDPVQFQRAVPKENVISIEPSDMFVQNADAFIDPRRVTLVSGNPKSLIQARQMGMSTLSSPRLRRLYKPDKPKVGRFSLDKGNYGNRPYALEQQRLQQRRGAPTIGDFRLIENQYGLNSGVIPMSEYLQNPLSDAVKNMLEDPTKIRSWSYPNGREVQLIPGGTYLDKALYEESLVNKAPYKNVFYDPASHVEVNSGVTNRGKLNEKD